MIIHETTALKEVPQSCLILVVSSDDAGDEAQECK